MANQIVLFGEEDNLFRLMEASLNRIVSPRIEEMLHYYFGENIGHAADCLTNLSTSLGLPITIRGMVCDQEDRLETLITEADYLVVERTSVTRRILEKGRGRLKFIQRFGSGYGNIDIAAAREMRIPVANFLRLTTISVAEHVMLFIIALARNFMRGHQAAVARLRATDGSRSEGPPRTLYDWGRVPNIQLVNGKTLGIVGVGEIGLEVAKHARAFGMKLRYHDQRRLPKSVEENAGTQYVPTLDGLMAEADFVTVHVPYGPSTEKMFTYEVLSRMKPGAFFINTSRGGLVDEEGLYRLLSEKKIMGAGLDMHRWEPIPSDSPMLRLDNVLWSTHNAGGAPEFLLEETRIVLQNIGRVSRGEEPVNLIKNEDH
jgi:phosphoglycerate dehydrogenase-like enzyme